MPSGSSPAMLGCLAGIGAEQCWWVGDSRGHTCSPQPSPAACPALRHPGEQGRKAPAGLSPSNVGGKVHDTSPIMLNSYLFPFSGDMGSASLVLTPCFCKAEAPSLCEFHGMVLCLSHTCWFWKKQQEIHLQYRT